MFDLIFHFFRINKINGITTQVAAGTLYRAEGIFNIDKICKECTVNIWESVWLPIEQQIIIWVQCDGNKYTTD